MDPLSALRDFTIRGELDNIVRVNDELRFGSDYVFPCSIETAYRSKQGNLYTLETLLHYVTHSHLKHTAYIINARSLSLPVVAQKAGDVVEICIDAPSRVGVGMRNPRWSFVAQKAGDAHERERRRGDERRDDVWCGLAEN